VAEPIGPAESAAPVVWEIDLAVSAVLAELAVPVESIDPASTTDQAVLAAPEV
jgi:hypothetical protein